MKSIVMTAQDAREFDKLGGLVIAKPIKPAPAYIEGATIASTEAGQWAVVTAEGTRLSAESGGADMLAPPVQPGDAVFIREPWYRLKTPGGDDSERVILASDTTAEPVAYKWASPVSMPEDASRHFARVASVTPIYNENVTAWEITLEKIDKAAAVAADAGLPYSSAPDEEGRSDYFTLGADMTAEDHEKMVAAIDADRARLEAIRSRRREIAIKLGGGVTDFGEGEALEDEEATLAREEGEIVSNLEDAHVPTDNPLPHPAEIRQKAAILKDVQDERRVLATLIADPAALGDMPPEEIVEAQECRVKKDEALVEEERALTAYLDAIRVGEPPTTTTEPTASDTGETPTAEGAAEEDEESGSFTLGQCKYCGREWGVTLEGAPGGGFPTQRTADAAATRACDCDEAVTNRASIIGVALAVTTGACRHCGQMVEVGPHPSQNAADETASEVCNCPDARRERRILEQTEEARDRVHRLFGDGAEALGFKAVSDDAVELLGLVVEMIARGPISSASLNIRGQCKAKCSITSKGKIKVSRSETRSCDLEAGE